jgi:hypothetical protein
MKIALLGYTGFVGGYLKAIFPSASMYNSSNISEISGESFDLLLISAMPAEKWKANKFPEQDKENLEKLKGELSNVDSRQTVLISTVDVFEFPTGVLESDTPKCSESQAYGTNRRDFEQFIESKFSETWIVRLPGLVGPGLKKNVIYDLKNKQSTSAVPLNSVFQFYPMNRLQRDLHVVMKSTPGFFHLAVEPISMDEICDEFGLDKSAFALPSSAAPFYDFRTEKAVNWGQDGQYLVSKEECLEAIGNYLNDF